MMTPIWAKEMLGTTVRTSAGEALGTIKDFVFASDLSTVTHVSVADRELPLTALVLDTENECFVLTDGKAAGPRRQSAGVS